MAIRAVVVASASSAPGSGFPPASTGTTGSGTATAAGSSGADTASMADCDAAAVALWAAVGSPPPGAAAVAAAGGAAAAAPPGGAAAGASAASLAAEAAACISPTFSSGFGPAAFFWDSIGPRSAASLLRSISPGARSSSSPPPSVSFWRIRSATSGGYPDRSAFGRAPVSAAGSRRSAATLLLPALRCNASASCGVSGGGRPARPGIAMCGAPTGAEPSAAGAGAGPAGSTSSTCPSNSLTGR